MDEKTPDNSFICEECGEHMLDGNMCVLSCTKAYEGLICVGCAQTKYPKQLKAAVEERMCEIREERKNRDMLSRRWSTKTDSASSRVVESRASAGGYELLVMECGGGGYQLAVFNNNAMLSNTQLGAKTMRAARSEAVETFKRQLRGALFALEQLEG